MDERDVAVASGLLTPAEIEAPFYSIDRRWRMLEVMKEMGSRGWIRAEISAREGTYRVWPTSQGEAYCLKRLFPWYSRLWLRLRRG
ncbi:MAG: hypothetical protein HYU29_07165 [Chloroflexi bacterium]|nr:hypothetical protein [Chloroflexota bacterium]